VWRAVHDREFSEVFIERYQYSFFPVSVCQDFFVPRIL
jgi:hypothetical protein